MFFIEALFVSLNAAIDPRVLKERTDFFEKDTGSRDYSNLQGYNITRLAALFATRWRCWFGCSSLPGSLWRVRSEQVSDSLWKFISHQFICGG